MSRRTWKWSRALALAHQPQLWGPANPTVKLQVLLFGAFQMLQVLLERCFVKLRQELRLGRGVVAANVVDELTFIHIGFTFAERIVGLRPLCGSATWALTRP